MYEKRNPTTITGTARQQIVSRSGVALQRQYLFMPEDSWQALHRLCSIQQRSGSQVIQFLISTADLGTREDADDIEINRAK